MQSPSISRQSVVGALLALVLVFTGFASARASVNSISKYVEGAPTTNGQGTILFVGDSLSVGTLYFGKMQQKIVDLGQWTGVNVDAKTGRRASAAVPILDKKITPNTSAIVIALGTNDMISRGESWYPAKVIANVMSHTAGRPVLWVNVKFSPTARGDWRLRATRFNKRLEEAKATWPNLYTADWNTFFIPTGGTRNVADGVHLTVKAYQVRTNFVVNEINKFGNAIVAATSTTSSTTTTTSPTTTSAAPSTTTSSTSTTTSTCPLCNS